MFRTEQYFTYVDNLFRIDTEDGYLAKYSFSY